MSAPENLNLQALVTQEKNPRGIPGAKFIDDVEQFVQSGSVEAALGAFNELYSKYKFMESNFEKSRDLYKSKIPEISNTLELIKAMKTRQEEGEKMFTNYSLSDTIYARAELELDQQKVCLWIGANTMVEYSFDEAIELLETQLTNAHAKIQELEEDLYFLRGNSITVEVNMARLFNYSVKQRKMKESSHVPSPAVAAN